MYERAFRLSPERSAIAGAIVAALAFCIGAEPASAQGIGRPSVIVDESVLDKLGPPPQTLPDVLLQQQPQNARPAQRVGTDAAATSATPGRLLPPPRSMPKSRVMLPRSLQSALPDEAPAAAPQPVRAPKVAPPRVEKPAPSAPPPVATAAPEPSAEPSVVPPKIVPPKVSVPEAPSVAPPPPAAAAPEPARETAAVSPAEPAATTPEPAKPAAPKASASEPVAAPPSVPKLLPPAPAESAGAAPASQPMPEAASVPKPPAIEPPPPPAAESGPAPAPAPAIAGKAPSPRVTKPVPALAATAPQESREGGESPASQAQVAALPAATEPEVLDNGQLYRIPFGSASSEISDEGKKHLDALAQRLKKDDALRLQLLGYAAGTQDSASKARRTSLFRALSVRTYLMKQGIRSTRMDVRALGNLAEGGAPDRVDAVIRK